MKILKILPLLFIMLASCEKEDLPPEHQEQLIIDIENPQSYSFSDLRDPYAGWKDKCNGQIEKGDRYQVEVEGSTVKIWSIQPIIKAEYLTNAMDLHPEILEVNQDNSITKYDPGKEGVFRLTY